MNPLKKCVVKYMPIKKKNGPGTFKFVASASVHLALYSYFKKAY